MEVVEQLSITSSTRENEVAIRTWSDLPTELVSPIADRLGIIELLSFRGTCKDWHSASSTASAQIESSPNSKPWFLLVGENSQCTLYNQANRKKFTVDIPELDGTSCLASNQGWLLLLRQGSIFFFCPFSRSRIDLPMFPHQEVNDRVAAISAPPTSQDCIVSVFNRRDELRVELNVLHRGDKTWTTQEYICPRSHLGMVMGTVYYGGKFYFLDNENGLLTFSVGDKIWTPYRVVQNREKGEPVLPFIYRNFFFTNLNMKECLDLEDGVSISTCGVQMSGQEHDIVIKNEIVKASKESEIRQMKGIWIQPRFLQVPPNMSW